jgi:hypothetical protein
MHKSSCLQLRRGFQYRQKIQLAAAVSRFLEILRRKPAEAFA